MSDLAKWKVHGPVKTLKSEFATWDANRMDWQPAENFNEASFRPDGSLASIEAHNPDGSIVHSRFSYDDAGRMVERAAWMNSEPVNRIVYDYDASGRQLRTRRVNQDGTETEIEVYRYDDAGAKTRVEFWPPPEAGDRGEVSTLLHVEGTNAGFTVTGAATITVSYDQNDRPARVFCHDANHQLVSSVTLTRGAEGRLVREEMHHGEKSPLWAVLEQAPPEQREQLAAAIKAAIGDTLSSTTYAYDARGRLARRESQMGRLGGTNTSYRYGDHDDPIEETTEHQSREAGFDETGTVRYSPDSVNIQHNRLDYVYDEQGNWTERMVSYRLDTEADFRRSNMERRTITYYLNS